MALLPVAAILLLSFYLYRLFSDPLRAIPGPFWTRFSRFWELIQTRRSNFEEVNIDLHKQYGPIVRLAPGRYSINDSAATKQIYGHASKFTKTKFYHAFGNPDGENADMFSELDIHRHSQKRRKVASLYSMTSLLSYEPFVDRQNAVLCKKLHDFAVAESSVDIPKWMQFYAFDVIGEMTVGEPFGMMNAGADENGILQAIHESSVYGSRLGLFGELHYYLGLMTKAFGVKIPFDIVADFINKHIALRESGKHSSDRADFLSILMKLKKEGKINDLDRVTTMGANIAAGSDTTAISLSSLIHFLAMQPDCVKRLRDEIQQFEKDGRISNPVKFQEAQKMPYLQAVIKETLRLHPATGQPMARTVPPGGAELAGTFFPAGATVGMNPWVLHRNKDIFGPDAGLFRPERWLGDAAEVSKMEQNFYAFGGGARTCIGKNISLLEISKVVPQLYRQFEFVSGNGHTYAKDCVWFVKPHFEMNIALRET